MIRWEIIKTLANSNGIAAWKSNGQLESIKLPATLPSSLAQKLFLVEPK